MKNGHKASVIFIVHKHQLIVYSTIKKCIVHVDNKQMIICKKMKSRIMKLKNKQNNNDNRDYTYYWVILNLLNNNSTSIYTIYTTLFNKHKQHTLYNITYTLLIGIVRNKSETAECGKIVCLLGLCRPQDNFASIYIQNNTPSTVSLQ